jgi:predicted transcriptional regulator
MNIKGRKNRRPTDIVADILKACSNGDTKTHIMYKANLSFPLLQKYLGLLLDQRLIFQNTFEYRISELGRDFLQMYEETNLTRSILQKREEELQRVFPLINENRKLRVSRNNSPQLSKI